MTEQTTAISNAHNTVQQLLDYIDHSPSPWHAVSTTVEILQLHGFEELEENEDWPLRASGRYYTIRDQSSIIAFIAGTQPPSQSGYRIIGTHTDSPGLRIKPNPISQKGPWLRVGVEVYGGPILATFADRDLSLAGRVSIKTGDKVTDFESRLVKFDESLMRLPNLAIHLNRMVNKEGLKFNQQTQLPLILSLAPEEKDNTNYFHQILAKAMSVNVEDILAWELAIYDTQKGGFFGDEKQFFANSQLDNLASCHSALLALLADVKVADSKDDPSSCSQSATRMIAMFDHEEVGSGSAKGADSNFLENILSRIGAALDDDGTQNQLHARANSYMLSADMSHAFHPNYSTSHDPEHQPIINSGPVIKINHNQRYTTDAHTEALFVNICKKAGVPYQKFVNRTDLACGSTIGPMSAAKTGIKSVDVGNPMWSMHSIRESAGVMDHEYMIDAMTEFFRT